MRSKGKLANTLFFLSLLCVFVMGSVLVISYQIRGYQNIVESNNQLLNTYTPLSYLSNKVRSHDVANQLYQIEREQTPILCIEDTNGIFYIYHREGKLYELYAGKDYQLLLSDGDAIFTVDDFTFTLDKQHIVFTVTQNKEEQSQYVRLRTQEGSVR